MSHGIFPQNGVSQIQARLVAGSHMTDAPATIMHACLVSRETVRIALEIAALNDLDIRSGMI